MLDLKFRVPDLEGFKLKVDLEEILDESAAFLLSRILTRYMAELDPDGKPWVPSKAGMARRLKGGTGTLFDTGRLYRSIQVYNDGEGKRRIGTDVPYGLIHQKGLRGFPVRKFIGFSKDDEVMVRQIVEMRVKEMLK